MKQNILNRPLIFLLILSSTLFVSCERFFRNQINPIETVRYYGRIVEAYDANRPIDSVLVEGCNLSLFVAFIPQGSAPCDTQVYTDSDGYFDLQFNVEKFDLRGLNYSKEGYITLDSCIILSDGSYECYLEPIPTRFYIYSPTKKGIPFIYDSASFKVQTTEIIETKGAWTDYFINYWADTVYEWNFHQDPSSYSSNSFSWEIEDNSEVILEASYFNDDILVKIDIATILCPKGEGTGYKILDE